MHPCFSSHPRGARKNATSLDVAVPRGPSAPNADPLADHMRAAYTGTSARYAGKLVTYSPRTRHASARCSRARPDHPRQTRGSTLNVTVNCGLGPSAPEARRLDSLTCGAALAEGHPRKQRGDRETTHRSRSGSMNAPSALRTATQRIVDRCPQHEPSAHGARAATADISPTA